MSNTMGPPPNRGQMNVSDVMNPPDGGQNNVSSVITPLNGSQENVDSQNMSEDTAMKDAGNDDGDVAMRSSTPHQEGNQDKKYDTPPRNLEEAVSPLSSRKNGTTRAQSLGISPSAGRGDQPRALPVQHSQNPFTSNQSRVIRNIQSAPRLKIIQRHRHYGIMEPPITPIGMHGSSPRMIASKMDNLGNVPRSFDEAVRSPIIAVTNTRAQEPEYRQVSREPFDLDPYCHRADEIGANHGIPGIGHLAEWLKPPGWQRGQVPLNHDAVEALYHDARKLARSGLQRPDIDDPEKTRQQEFEWSMQLELDQLLLKERILIYERYCERQMESIRAERSRLPTPGGKMTTPAHSQFPPDVHSLAANQNLPMAGETNTRFQPEHTPSYYHSTGSNTLHPALHSATITQTLDRYHQDNAEILRRKAEIDNNLRSCLSQFHTSDGRHISNTLMSTAGNLESNQTSFGSDLQPQTAPQNLSSMRPPAYVSPRRSAIPQTGPSPFVEGPYFQEAGSSLASSQPAFYQPPISHPYTAYYDTTHQLAGVQTPFSREQSPAETEEAIKDTSRGITPTKGRPRKGVTTVGTAITKPRTKPWYDGSVNQSTVPHTEISEESMAKGMAYVANHPNGKRAAVEEASEPPPKPKRRRTKKELPDPAVGMAISEDAARHLLAAGARNGLGDYQIPPPQPRSVAKPKNAKKSGNLEMAPHLREKLEVLKANIAAQRAEEQQRWMGTARMDGPPLSSAPMPLAAAPRQAPGGTHPYYATMRNRGPQARPTETASGQPSETLRQFPTPAHSRGPNPAHLGIIQFASSTNQANSHSLGVLNRGLSAQEYRPTIDLTGSSPSPQAVPAQGSFPLSSSQIASNQQNDEKDDEESNETEELSSVETSEPDTDDEDFSEKTPKKPAKKSIAAKISTGRAKAVRTATTSSRNVKTSHGRVLRSSASVDLGNASSNLHKEHGQDKTDEDDGDRMEE